MSGSFKLRGSTLVHMLHACLVQSMKCPDPLLTA